MCVSVLDDDFMESESVPFLHMLSQRTHVRFTPHTETTCLNSDPAQGNKTALFKQAKN